MSKLAEPEGEPEDCYTSLGWVREASRKIKEESPSRRSGYTSGRYDEYDESTRTFRTESLHPSSSDIPLGEGDKSNPSLVAASDKISSHASHWLGRRETAGWLGKKPSSKYGEEMVWRRVIAVQAEC